LIASALGSFQISYAISEQLRLFPKRLILLFDGGTLLIALLDNGQQFRLPLVPGDAVVPILKVGKSRDDQGK